MITQILTILILITIIGSIVYGRRLIQTEKIDAVFGNPERSKGGTHWVVLGSCSLLLIWMYYSWDIARGFYPKSANELCQVAKINDSLLGLKYQFPIEQRELKSTLYRWKHTKSGSGTICTPTMLPPARECTLSLPSPGRGRVILRFFATRLGWTMHDDSRALGRANPSGSCHPSWHPQHRAPELAVD